MTDKKSVRVLLADLTTVDYVAKDGVSYDFQIGEHNGCLLIVEKRATESVISGFNFVDIYKAYGNGAWKEADLI